MSIDLKAALLEEYALVARAMSAPARLMLLEQLAQGPRGVEGLADKTGLTIANTSQHLQTLRRAGLVTSCRNGKSVIYSMRDDKTLVFMELLRVLAERNLAQVEKILRQLSEGANGLEALSRDDLAARITQGAVTILDIRPADEFAMGHIPGAVNISLQDLELLLPDLSPEADIVAYCRGPYCIYAHQAVATLRKHGLNARRLDGGLPEWRADGRKVATA